MDSFIWKFLKNTFFIQNFLSTFFSSIPPVAEHNIGKYKAIKKAFYLTALEGLTGDYLEFGVFTGSSFVMSLKCDRKMSYLTKSTTTFYGFDSFEGFGDAGKDEAHPFYKDLNFKISAKTVKKNINNTAKNQKVVLTEGYFDKTLVKPAQEFGISKSRIIFIDCDLMGPSLDALNFCKPTIQNGTILLMDDFFSYFGNEDKGVCGAFNEFQKSNPQIKFRKLLDYGYGGVGYIVSNVSNS